ncbi:MAG: hypothetical protein KDD47_21670 [Acidobacteria bacterium]|nr:hypothetical protein [Acidobacteriota bacterium]
MKSSTAWLSVSLLLTVVTTPIPGHDLWSEPSDLSPGLGQTVEVEPRLAHDGGDVETLGPEMQPKTKRRNA